MDVCFIFIMLGPPLKTDQQPNRTRASLTLVHLRDPAYSKKREQATRRKKEKAGKECFIGLMKHE